MSSSRSSVRPTHASTSERIRPRAPLVVPNRGSRASWCAFVAVTVVWPFARHYFILHAETPALPRQPSADLAGWLMPPENTFVGQWLLAHNIKGPRWIWGEVTVYLGWITLGLAAIGAVVAVRSRDPLERRNRFFIVLAVVAGVLALGPWSSEVASGRYGWSPFGLLAHVPGVSLFRIPARYSQLLNLALASLAAVACAASHRRFGLARARSRSRWRRRCCSSSASSTSSISPADRRSRFAVPAVAEQDRDAAGRHRAVAPGLRETRRSGFSKPTTHAFSTQLIGTPP